MHSYLGRNEPILAVESKWKHRERRMGRWVRDVAASEDGALVISDRVVHALIETREKSDEFDTRCNRGASTEGTEDAELDVRMEAQACDRPCPAPQLQTIDNDSDRHATISRGDQAPEE